MTLTNFVPNPSFEASTTLTDWSEYNSNSNLYSYVDTSNKRFGTQSLRIQNAVTGDYGRTATISLPAGTYTAGASAQTIAGGSGSAFVQCCFVVRDHTSLNILVEQHWTTVNGTWTDKSQTFTLSSAATVDVLVGVGSYGSQSGGSARFDAVFVENLATGAFYFDGSFAADTNYTYGWAGTVNNSASIATPVGSSTGGSTGGGSTGGGTTTPGTTIQGWDLVEHNDFTTASSIDTSRFYIYDGFAGTNGDGTYSASRVFLSGGALVLQPDGDTTAGFSSQHQPLTYGKWVIRTDVTPYAGYKWVVFLWPDTEIWNEGELDFFECTDSTGATFQIFFHKPGNPTDNSKNTRVTQNIHSAIVEMSIEWLPSRVTVLCNGTKVYEITDPAYIPSTPMHLVGQIDVGTSDGKNGIPQRAGYPAALNPPFQAKVTEIDIYQPTTWYANGSPPTSDVTTRRSQARALWDAFKSACFTQTGMPSGMPAGAWRVQRPENGNDTVSEGLGYGMILAAYYSNSALPSGIYDPQAKALFDGLWTYAKYYRLSTGVINWHEYSDGTKGTGNDSGGATDADQDMAFALDMMDKIQGSTPAYPYLNDSKALWAAIGATEYVPATGHAYPNVMANGDQWGVDTDWYMPDYFHPAGMRNAYASSGDSAWLDRIAANYPIARGIWNTNYTTGFVPDQSTRSGAAIGGQSYLWSYNAIRTWRTTLDYLWNGSNADSLAHTMATKMANYAKAQTGGTPANFFAEYSLDGTSHASYTNMAFIQAVGIAALADSSNSDFAAACLTYLYNNRTVSGNATYFGLSLGAIAGLMMSGLMQPYTTTAPGKALAATSASTSTGTASLQVKRNLTASVATTSVGRAVLSVGRSLAAAAASVSSAIGSLTVGTTHPTVLLQARGGSSSASYGALFRSSQALSAIGPSSTSGLAVLSTSRDLSTRPVVTDLAEEIYAALGSFTLDDDKNGWQLLRFVAALAINSQSTQDLVRDGEYAGWSSIMDLGRAPDSALPWLAQFIGVDIPADLDPASQRIRIRETAGFQRGTLGAIQGAARQYLTGNRTVVVSERDTSPYHFKVTVFSAETPNAAKVQAAVEAQKPAGLVLEFVVSSGASYNALKATGLEYHELYNAYPTYDAMKIAVLV